MVMVDIQFYLIEKIKIQRREHWLTPHPLRPITSHFFLNPLKVYHPLLVSLFNRLSKFKHIKHTEKV